jgi:hypothetical protein
MGDAFNGLGREVGLAALVDRGLGDHHQLDGHRDRVAAVHAGERRSGLHAAEPIRFVPPAAASRRPAPSVEAEDEDLTNDEDDEDDEPAGARVDGDGGARKRPPRVLRGRVLVGAGMLEPIKTFRWRGETFTAGLTRVAPTHPVCSSEAAALLVPCYSKEDDPRVLEVYERATGRRWDATSRANAPARTSVNSPSRTPLYGEPGYSSGPGSSPPRESDASFLGPILSQWMRK